MRDKTRCGDCGWVGSTSHLLVAVNPFEPEYRMYACPECKCFLDLRTACDEDGCKQEACAGTPTPAGYRWTCHEHLPRLMQAR